MNENKSETCRNCGYPVRDQNFCPQCGQENTDKRISLKEIFSDFFGDYFTFDSRWFRSLYPLIFKPGFLTKEYVEGRRIRYLLPLRLYLFTTFIFFFLLTFKAGLDREEVGNELFPKQSEAVDSLRTLFRQNSFKMPTIPREKLIAEIDSSFYLKIRKKNSKINYSFSDSTRNWFTQFLKNKAVYLSTKGDEAGDLFISEMVNQIPTVLFMMLPLFALILKVLYIRRKKFYVEHLIFSLHFHTFVFLILILTIFFSHWILSLAISLGLFLYLYKAQKTFYQQSGFKTGFKMLILFFSYSFFILPAFLILLLLAVMNI